MSQSKRIEIAVTPLICLSVLACAPAWASGVTGAYTQKSESAAALLELVQTEGGHLTGRLELVSVLPSGEFHDVSTPVSGAADGQTISLTATPTEPLARPVTFSGSLKGGVLHLSGGGAINLDLARSDDKAFPAEVAKLNSLATKVTTTRVNREAAKHEAEVEGKQLDELIGLNGRMKAFVSEADAELPKFTPVEQTYRDSTGRMRNGLTRQRAISGGSQAAVARSQLYVSINQVAIQASATHMQVQGAFQTFRLHLAPLDRSATNFEQLCNAAPSVAAPWRGETWANACDQFSTTDKVFRQRVTALKAAFQNAENVWSEQKHEQDSIADAALKATS